MAKKLRGVSTRSRPKAAGKSLATSIFSKHCFNTQPPEGGWRAIQKWVVLMIMFQHAAARRRLGPKALHSDKLLKFQHAAARRRLAVKFFDADDVALFQHAAARRRLGSFIGCPNRRNRCFNTQPPEGGWILNLLLIGGFGVSTRSRPKAAGLNSLPTAKARNCFNTQPPEGGWLW